MSQIKRLQTIDADTLQSTAYEPVSFVVDDLLPQGLHLLAGAPKIGKSWLALWLCLCAAQGKPLWTFATRPCEVLYLCLEDSFQRIQSRLFDLTEDAPPTLHFAVMSQQLHNGLVEQIEQFLKEHPQTRLIVIDTLQRIRTAGNDANPYASDYRDIGVLKALADKHRIAILLVHHLRKMNDDDPMNMISGTTGLSGATDSNFVLRKSKRRENTATLYCTGRDIPYRELALEFDGEDHVWKLLSDDCEQTEQPSERILFLLSLTSRCSISPIVVFFHINDEFYFFFRVAISRQIRQVLQRVQRLTMFANQNTQIFTAQIDGHRAFFFWNSHFQFYCNMHGLKQVA